MSTMRKGKITVPENVQGETLKMDSPTEKTKAVHVIQEMNVLGLSDDDFHFYNSVSDADRKRITRKVCLHHQVQHSEYILKDFVCRSIFALFQCFPCSIYLLTSIEPTSETRKLKIWIKI